MDPNLAPEILLAAYANGIFPMADEDGRLMWFSPDPRAVIELDAFHVPRTLGSLCRKRRFDLTVNREFGAVMLACADRAEGTWISEDIFEAYGRLHTLGYAHSVEAWQDGELAGGLYGVEVGAIFCGESMFHVRRDASKVALVYLVERMVQKGFCLLDIQFMTPHLARFGAVDIPREEYLQRLSLAVEKQCGFAE